MENLKCPELLHPPRKYASEIPYPEAGLIHDDILRHYANLDADKYYFEDVAKAYYTREILVSPELEWDKLKQGDQLMEIAKIVNMFKHFKKEGKMDTKALAVSNGIVMPAVSKEEALKAFDAYQDLAKAILRPEDVQNISGKEFKKKSFWRKCLRFFNLSLNIMSEVREENNGVITYKFVVRATAPNGAYMDATGTCSSNEKGLTKTEHNTRAIAETRAKNRAIADLVAFGEVSAEEVTAEEHYSPKTQARPVKSETEPVSHPDNVIIDQVQPAKSGKVLGIIQASNAEVGKVVDIQGQILSFTERHPKGKDITDYTVGDEETDHTIVISKWGLTHEGVEENCWAVFKDVIVGEYKEKRQYNAKTIDVII